MRAKLLVLALTCFFVFAYCNSPADPEIEKALNPGPIEPTSYSITFELAVSHDNPATGGFSLYLYEETPEGSEGPYVGDLDFSPLPDNPDVSEGAVIFSEGRPPGTYNVVFLLACYNDLESGEITPGEWILKMSVSSSNLDLLIAGGLQEQSYALVQVGRDTAWLTFSISE